MADETRVALGEGSPASAAPGIAAAIRSYVLETAPVKAHCLDASHIVHSLAGRPAGLSATVLWLCLWLVCPGVWAAGASAVAVTRPIVAPVANRFPKTAFHQAVCAALRQRGIDPESVCDPSRPAELRILAEYGAIFVAAAAVRLPPRCIFPDEAAVNRFQTLAQARSAMVGRTPVVLQPAALAAFQAACAEAKQAGLAISLKGGAKASRRSLADTEEVWKRYVEEALRNWRKKGRLSRDDAARLRQLPVSEQAEQILKLEAQGLYFGLAQRKPILSSAAIPGTSQHLSLLALDIVEYASPEVRRVLAKHGWHQTVLDDFPHFTWLGAGEEQLPGLGLHPVRSARQTFWLPSLGE